MTLRPTPDVDISRTDGPGSAHPGVRSGPSRRAVLAGTALGAVAAVGTASTATATAAVVPGTDPDFGPNVTVFDPTMPAADVQAAFDAALAVMESNQFGTQRYTFLFKPGTYAVTAQLGYYTTVAGLGASPDDVVIDGGVIVWAQDRFTPARSSLDNFWRSAENLSIVPTGGTNWWAVSQASPLRRVDVKGQLGLFDYLGGFASGGFLADSHVDTTVINAPQQQWLTRDASIGSWSNGVWNQVFAGVEGAPAQSFPSPPYTTLDTDPVSREKPFLRVDANGCWDVFVPAPRRDSRGTTWEAGPAAGTAVGIDRFFLAKPTDPVSRINRALRQGKHLILTPGVYEVEDTIRVTRPGTIVLGLGMATIEPRHGVVAMSVGDVRGVDISGIIFDAGPVRSPVLLEVGPRRSARARDRDRGRGRHGDAAHPTGLQDVFFRIGGAHVGRVGVALEVNSDHVVLDDVWAWRADHGTGVGWTVNTADTGVVVNGDDVTATGLFVEHFQRYDVIWNGERGRTVMFQNEMPYDPPSQAAWRRGPVDGYAAYKVADSVRHHEGWGLGSYCFFTADPTIHATRAFEVPDTPGVVLHDVLTVSLNDSGTIDHIVDDTGAPTPAGTVPSNLVRYPVAT